MDDRQGVGASEMRMCVFVVWRAVRGPTGVANADRPVDRGLSHFLFEQIDPPGGLYNRELSIGGFRGDPGAVVATIFEAMQPFEQIAGGFTVSNVTHDAAHMETLRTKKNL